MVKKKIIRGIAAVIVGAMVLLLVGGQGFGRMHNNSSVGEMEASNEYLLAGTYSSNDYISFEDYDTYMISFGATGKSYSMNELRELFPNGRYWNHEGNPSSTNPDSITDRPCHNTSYDPSCCNLFSYGAQCAGYAMRMMYLYHGSNLDPKYYGVSHNLDELKIGDAVRINWYGGAYDHMIFVTGISGNTITYSDCNADLHCRIAWDKTISKSELAQMMTYRLNQAWSYPNQSSDTGFILSWDKRQTPEPPKVIIIDTEDASTEPSNIIDNNSTTNIQYKISTCKVHYDKVAEYSGYINTPNITLYYANGIEVPKNYYYIDDEASFLVEPNTTYKITIKASAFGDLVGNTVIEYKYDTCDINSEYVLYYQQDDGSVYLSNLCSEKTLKKDVDYKITESNGTITIKGINNYTGTIIDKVKNTTQPTPKSTESNISQKTEPTIQEQTKSTDSTSSETQTTSTNVDSKPPVVNNESEPEDLVVNPVQNNKLSDDDKFKTNPVAVSNNKGEIRVTWNKASGADMGYRIYVWDTKEVETYIENLVYIVLFRTLNDASFFTLNSAVLV